jgi:hypothetical protein
VAELAPYIRVLQVEKTLFRIPQFTLSQSKTFRERLLEPALEGTSSTDKYSLRLDGVRASEFRQLLRIILPLYVQSSNHGDLCTNMDCSDHAASTELNADEAMSALKLSTLWDFPSVRHMAITSLSSFTLEDPILKIVASQMYSIHDWLVPAVNALAQREQPLTLADVSRLKVLGDADVVMDLVLKIAHVRESVSTSGIASEAASKRRTCDFTPAILATFGLDTGGDQNVFSGLALDKRVGTDGRASASDAVQPDATDQTAPPATNMSLAGPDLDPETALEDRQPKMQAMEETIRCHGQHLSAVSERTRVLVQEVCKLEERKAELLADESEAQVTLNQKRAELQSAHVEVEAVREQLAALERSLEFAQHRQQSGNTSSLTSLSPVRACPSSLPHLPPGFVSAGQTPVIEPAQPSPTVMQTRPFGFTPTSYISPAHMQPDATEEESDPSTSSLFDFLSDLVTRPSPWHSSSHSILRKPTPLSESHSPEGGDFALWRAPPRPPHSSKLMNEQDAYNGGLFNLWQGVFRTPRAPLADPRPVAPEQLEDDVATPPPTTLPVRRADPDDVVLRPTPGGAPPWPAIVFETIRPKYSGMPDLTQDLDDDHDSTTASDDEGVPLPGGMGDMD